MHWPAALISVHSACTVHLHRCYVRLQRQPRAGLDINLPCCCCRFGQSHTSIRQQRQSGQVRRRAVQEERATEERGQSTKSGLLNSAATGGPRRYCRAGWCLSRGLNSGATLPGISNDRWLLRLPCLVSAVLAVECCLLSGDPRLLARIGLLPALRGLPAAAAASPLACRSLCGLAAAAALCRLQAGVAAPSATACSWPCTVGAANGEPGGTLGSCAAAAASPGGGAVDGRLTWLSLLGPRCAGGKPGDTPLPPPPPPPPPVCCAARACMRSWKEASSRASKLRLRLVCRKCRRPEGSDAGAAAGCLCRRGLLRHGRLLLLLLLHCRRRLPRRRCQRGARLRGAA